MSKSKLPKAAVINDLKMLVSGGEMLYDLMGDDTLPYKEIYYNALAIIKEVGQALEGGYFSENYVSEKLSNIKMDLIRAGRVNP
jgi:hypothetical protein